MPTVLITGTSTGIGRVTMEVLAQRGWHVFATMRDLQKRVRWKKKDAKKFYDVHKDQPFFKDLVNFMTSGPIVLQVLEGENAIARNREVMGATNPVDARPGTIRKDFGVNLQRNSVHGSDSAKTAKREIALCFKKNEIVG